jgi:hypothetical protein
VRTDLRGADLTSCRIYGISVWEPKLDEDTKQQNLVITHLNEPVITVELTQVSDKDPTTKRSSPALRPASKRL